jgi:hypothetical protein
MKDCIEKMDLMLFRDNETENERVMNLLSLYCISYRQDMEQREVTVFPKAQCGVVQSI